MATRLRVPGTGADLKSLRDTEALFSKFSHASAIGFAICDTQLCYRCVNRSLASSHRLPIEGHIGRTVGDVLGETAAIVEPLFRRVAETGQPISQSVSGRMPRRKGVCDWLASYFPVAASTKRVSTVAVVVIEITELKELNRLFLRGDAELLDGRYRADSVLAVESQAAVQQYCTALSRSVTQLSRHNWLLDSSADEQLTPFVTVLDQRIELMRNLIAEVAARLSVQKQD